MYIISASALLAIIDVPGEGDIPTSWRYAPARTKRRVVADCQRHIDEVSAFSLWVGEGTDNPRARVPAFAVPLPAGTWLLSLQPGSLLGLMPSVAALIGTPLDVVWHGVPSGVPSPTVFWHEWCREVAEFITQHPRGTFAAGSVALRRASMKLVPWMTRAAARAERENT